MKCFESRTLVTMMWIAALISVIFLARTVVDYFMVDRVTRIVTQWTKEMGEEIKAMDDWTPKEWK